MSTLELQRFEYLRDQHSSGHILSQGTPMFLTNLSFRVEGKL